MKNIIRLTVFPTVLILAVFILNIVLKSNLTVGIISAVVVCALFILFYLHEPLGIVALHCVAVIFAVAAAQSIDDTIARAVTAVLASVLVTCGSYLVLVDDYTMPIKNYYISLTIQFVVTLLPMLFITLWL